MHKIAWLADLFCCKPQPTTAKLDLPLLSSWTNSLSDIRPTLDSREPIVSTFAYVKRRKFCKTAHINETSQELRMLSRSLSVY